MSILLASLHQVVELKRQSSASSCASHDAHHQALAGSAHSPWSVPPASAEPSAEPPATAEPCSDDDGLTTVEFAVGKMGLLYMGNTVTDVIPGGQAHTHTHSHTHTHMHA